MKLLLLVPLLALWNAVQGKEYTVYVKTSSNPMFTGTNANVWIKIHGVKGVTDTIKLKGGRGKFEQGHEDVFKVEGKDVGFVNAVEVKRDDSGVGSDWRLSFIQVAVNNVRYPPAIFNKWIKPKRWYKENGSEGRMPY